MGAELRCVNGRRGRALGAERAGVGGAVGGETFLSHVATHATASERGECGCGVARNYVSSLSYSAINRVCFGKQDALIVLSATQQRMLHHPPAVSPVPNNDRDNDVFTQPWHTVFKRCAAPSARGEFVIACWYVLTDADRLDPALTITT